MTDEEKKAIERLIIYKDKIKDELYPIIDFEEEKAIGIVLNLIEKQSKEIEELKEKFSETYEYFKRDFTPNDKIKAEIEELQEDIKYSANPLSIDNSKFGIKVLQSLLEKE